MGGNVEEWCLNEYENPEQVGLKGDAPRVLRGGSFDYGRLDARAAYRSHYGPYDWYGYGRGFRVVVGRAPKGSGL